MDQELLLEKSLEAEEEVIHVPLFMLLYDGVVIQIILFDETLLGAVVFEQLFLTGAFPVGIVAIFSNLEEDLLEGGDADSIGPDS